MVRILLSIIMVVLIFTLIVQARTAQSNQCPAPHEIYNACGNACPNTCGDVLNLNPPKACTHQCVMGCFCEYGYVRENEDLTSRCIKTIECDTTV